jgi:hypothetical protein
MDSDSSPVPTYTPIMRQILDSSVWEADVRARVLWITMLVTASEPGRRGTVDMTLRALAGRACLPVEDTIDALAVLSSPDPTSRTRAEEGRRIVLLDATGRDWGWRIVNWEKYAKAQERMYAAARQKSLRKRRKNATAERVQGTTPLRGVTGNVDRKGKERKRERGGPPPEGASLSGFPSLGEVEELWSSEGLRGSGERFFRWHSARSWEGIGDWREAARLWSLRERENPARTPLSDWGAGRPPEADQETRESEEAI